MRLLCIKKLEGDEFISPERMTQISFIHRNISSNVLNKVRPYTMSYFAKYFLFEMLPRQINSHIVQESLSCTQLGACVISHSF